jgi:hypothetical protein
VRHLLLWSCLAATGCSIFEQDPAERVLEGSDEKHPITVGELEERTRNLADRYVQVLADACEALKSSAPTATVRQRAHHLKLLSATSAFDIVTSSHPLQEMLDLLVQVELQHLVWVEEGRAWEMFHEAGEKRLIPAIKKAREEILALALRAMKRKRLAEVQALVRSWRKRNPEVGNVTFIRFGPFLDEPEGDTVSKILSGFGVISLSHLNPLEPASESVDQARKTADDALYLAKRFPMILDWQAEAATYNLLAALEASVASAEGAIQRGRALAQDAAETARAAQGAFEALAKITNPPGNDTEPEGAPSRPFDIREYGETAREARATLRELHDLVESPDLSRRIEEATAGAASIVTHALAAGVLLLLAFFGFLAGYRGFRAWLAKPRS